MVSRFKRVAEGPIAYQSPWLTVRECTVERDGVSSLYPVVHRPDAVIVVPLTPDRRTVLVRQFRFPISGTSWELPMGAVDAGESPDAAARREASEEIGLTAARLVSIGAYHPAPGLTPQTATVFVAMIADDELDRCLADWSASEELEAAVAVGLEDIGGMTADGRVSDGFTLAALLLLRNWLERTPSSLSEGSA
jgi:8-oxo-dGDP phosphatase